MGTAAEFRIDLTRRKDTHQLLRCSSNILETETIDAPPVLKFPGTAVGSENKIACAWAAAVAITAFLWQQGPRCGRGDAVQLLAGFLLIPEETHGHGKSTAGQLLHQRSVHRACEAKY